MASFLVLFMLSKQQLKNFVLVIEFGAKLLGVWKT